MMVTAPKVPSALLEHLRVLDEPGSLIVLTGVQNASPNWLILRFLSTILRGNAQASLHTEETTGSATNTISEAGSDAVILVSFLRDFEFWKAEARRAVGLDLVQASTADNFAFVDGLSVLFAPKQAASLASAPGPAGAAQRTPLPRRLVLEPKASSDVPSLPRTGLDTCVSEPSILALRTAIETSLLPSKRNTLILDTPSILLSQPLLTSSALLSALLQIRNKVHASIVAVPADAPLVAASPASAFNPVNDYGSAREALQNTLMDLESSAFVVGLCHQADTVLSCRLLDTGAAEDVSGVLRATGGGSTQISSASAVRFKGKCQEWLYHIAGDGNVKVWQRGAGHEGQVQS